MGRYLPQLDGIRAIAVTLVVLHHAGWLLTGYLGVQMFYVLSGYLITNIILNERERGTWSLRGFYARRMRRLYPALIAFLVLTLPFDSSILIRGSSTHQALVLLSAATYTAAFPAAIDQHWMGGMLHTWTLSVEEQFYLLWPILLAWGLAKKGRMRVVYAIAASMLVVLAFHGTPLMWFPGGAGWVICLGCFLALATRRRPIPQANWLATGSFVALLAIILVIAPHATVSTASAAGVLAGIATAGLIGGIVEGGVLARLLATRPMVWVGRRSYGIYLWHMPLYIILVSRGGSLVTARLLAIAAAVSLADFSYRFIEPRFWTPRLDANPEANVVQRQERTSVVELRHNGSIGTNDHLIREVERRAS